MTFMESERTRVELEKVIRELDLDAILITDRYNMRYIASYRGEGVIFYTKDAKYVLTDSRYTEQVERECDGYECIDIAGLGYAGNLNQLITTIKCSPEYTGSKVRVGFENLSISYSDYDIYQNKLDEAELVAIDGRLDSIREIKTDDEIEKLRVAESIGDAAFKYILGFLKEGITEKEVALELEYYMKKNGAEGLSFDTIAASGRNSSMPHAIPSDKRLEAGDFLTMDFGCIYDGYCSDMTRTVAIGYASDSMRSVYDIVLRAQLESMKHIKAGALCNEVDAAARRVIADAGYGNCFGHGLGHSVGLFIHENPRFSPKCNALLKPGIVITVEPGIYIPGQFGVRIEDLVVVTEDGFVNLARAEKSLIIV